MAIGRRTKIKWVLIKDRTLVKSYAASVKYVRDWAQGRRFKTKDQALGAKAVISRSTQHVVDVLMIDE